jgi:hypothetical protein
MISAAKVPTYENFFSGHLFLLHSSSRLLLSSTVSGLASNLVAARATKDVVHIVAALSTERIL